MNALLVDVGLPATGVAVVGVPAQNPEPPPGRGEEFGKASPIALVVILLLALATFLLVRNMTKRIKRLPESFDEPAAPSPDAAQHGHDSGDAGTPRG